MTNTTETTKALPGENGTSPFAAIFCDIECDRAVSDATRAAYDVALNSLGTDWRNLRDLPEDISFYDTLTDYGVAERRNEQVNKDGHPCGFRIFYRLADFKAEGR